MYQRTSDADNYLKKVGSHATKESKRGIIKASPRTPEPVAAQLGIVKEYLALKEHLTQKGVSRPAQKALKQRLRDMEGNTTRAR